MRGDNLFKVLTFVNVAIFRIVVTFIPNRPLRVKTKCTFNTFLKAVLYVVNVAVNDLVIFLLMEALNIGLLRIFFACRGVGSLGFLRGRGGMDLLYFFLFFLPNAPGSLLACFINLAGVSFGDFLFVITITHVPSVIASAVNNDLLNDRGCFFTTVTFNIALVVDLVN